jgi:hypothetical protein
MRLALRASDDCQVSVGHSMDPLRYGAHWSVLGFQSDDPVSDLRCVCSRDPVRSLQTSASLKLFPAFALFRSLI